MAHCDPVYISDQDASLAVKDHCLLWQRDIKVVPWLAGTTAAGAGAGGGVVAVAVRVPCAPEGGWHA